MFSSISRLWSSEASRSQYSIPDPSNDLPPSKTVCDLEGEDDKRTRTLRHLIKLDHANHALLDEQRRVNTVPDILAAAFALGYDADGLDILYEKATQAGISKWEDSPGEVSKLDWMDFLGHAEYQRAYLDFFEDEVVEMGYHWREMTMRYLYHGEQPLVGDIMSGGGRPLLRLAYGLALSSREITMEGLALLAACWREAPRSADRATGIRHGQESTEDLIVVMQQLLHSVHGKNGVALTDNSVNDFANSWKVESIVKATQQAQKVAALLFESRPSFEDGFADLLISTHGLVTILHGAPKHQAKSALLSWWQETLNTFVKSGCPDIALQGIRDQQPQRSWQELKQEVTLAVSEGANFHVLLLLDTLQLAAQTSPAENIFLDVAIKCLKKSQSVGG